MKFVFPFGVKHIESSSDLSSICSLQPKPVYLTVAFSALNVPCFYFKRTWQSVHSQGEQHSAKPTSLPHACFEPNAKGQAQCLCPQSLVQGAWFQASRGFPLISVGFTLVWSPHTAAFPKMFLPACWTLSWSPAALAHSEYLQGGRESFAVFSTRGAMPRQASRAGRGWKTQVAWLAAHSGLCICGPLKGDSLGQFVFSEVWPWHPGQ